MWSMHHFSQLEAFLGLLYYKIITTFAQTTLSAPILIPPAICKDVLLHLLLIRPHGRVARFQVFRIILYHL